MTPLIERNKVEKKDQWNVEALYPTFEEWQKDYQILVEKKDQPRWPLNQKGHLGESPQILKEALEKILELSRKIHKLYTYAHLRHDEDITNDKYKQAFSQITSILHDFAQEMAWFEPELIALPESTIQAYLASPTLAPYRFHIEKIVRIRHHMLPHEQEELLALAGKALQAPYKTFSAINDADFKFGKVKDSKGQETELTHGSYAIFIRDQDRLLRENAFKQFHGKYKDFENTLCELLNGQVQGHVFEARARKYSSCLEAALFPKNIDVDVYHSLIKAVHSKIDVLHKYNRLRKKILNLPELHLYDMYVPLTSQVDIRIPYEEAEEIIVTAVAPLGSEYQDTLQKGFKSERWVDRFENKNKRSGAYSSGCYDSMPYILMNYKKLLRDVFTLAHEAGHSMHSLMSHKNQPYHYGDYPIFLAEVASTFNEELLTRLLLQRAKTKEEKIFLINQKIEDIRGTLFRQTMFAEFELTLHQMAEQNIPLTPLQLKETYHKLNAFYFGPSTTVDSEIDIEWARIPHFYYNFYVFQYATGISAALALAERVCSGGDAEREAYLSFLKSGCSRYPIETLQLAGVNMHSPEPVEAAIKTFDKLVDQLSNIL